MRASGPDGDGRSAVERVRSALVRMDELAGGHWSNLVVARDDERALADAEAADRRRQAGTALGPLDGVPVAVKDNIDVEGLPTRVGSAAYDDAPPAASDAPVVARLRAAGAVVVAKTHLHELAYGPTGEVNPAGPARNPHDPRRITGGSSSGSAALVALGIVPLALGTDTGCSIRVPAALCGVVGLMPALGRLPTAGVVPLSTTLDHVGLLARDLAVARSGWQALSAQTLPRVEAEARSADPTAALWLDGPGGQGGGRRRTSRRSVEDAPRTGGGTGSGAGASAPRVGLVRGERFRSQAPVAAAVERAADTLRAGGAEVLDAWLPHVEELAATYPVIVGYEANAQHRDRALADPRLGAVTRERLEVSSASLAQHEDAVGVLTRLRAEILTGLDGLDALLLPTAPFVAPLLGQQQVAGEDVRAGLLRLCVPFSLLGTACVSVPARPVGALPVGLQLVAVGVGEESLLSLAALLTPPA